MLFSIAYYFQIATATFDKIDISTKNMPWEKDKLCSANALQDEKIGYLENSFQKIVSNLTVPEGIFETKFQGLFFFVPNNFYVDFFGKIEGDLNFLVNFLFGPIQF